MAESTKISFVHRRILQLADFAELFEVLFPGNRNQQYVGACIFFDLKWTNGLVPNMAHFETKYNTSRRILQRTRAKLSRLGLIEHVSHLNSRYGGKHGWKLSTRFEIALKQLAQRCAGFRDTNTTSRKKDLMLVEFTSARRDIGKEQNEQKDRGGDL